MPSENPCTVLIVDDDPDIRETLVDILATRGCNAVGAANGAEALRALREQGLQPCLILLDLMMPVMDGLAFRAAQRSDPTLADIPIVIISAFDRRSAKGMEAAGHLQKPIHLERLFGFVEKHCPRGATLN